MPTKAEDVPESIVNSSSSSSIVEEKNENNYDNENYKNNITNISNVTNSYITEVVSKSPIPVPVPISQSSYNMSPIKDIKNIINANDNINGSYEQTVIESTHHQVEGGGDRDQSEPVIEDLASFEIMTENEMSKLLDIQTSDK